MKRINKAVTAATIGAAGILALGACSSDSGDQVQESSSPTTQSSLSASEREAAAAKHDDHVTIPASKAAKFGDVAVTHNPQAKCTRNETADPSELVIRCTNVTRNAFGDAVYVRVPSKNYMIAVENLSYEKFLGMETVQRDHAASAHDRERGKQVQLWEAPNLWNANWGWGVGVESGNKQAIDIEIRVTKV